jgi:hypothetical protein
MYLSGYDIVALTIALVGAIALIITSASANARLTRQRNEWRDEAIRLQNVINEASPIVG